MTLRESKRQIVAENAAELAGLGLRPQQVAALQKLARQLHRLDEQLCNGFQDGKGDWDEKATERAERRQEQAERAAKKIGAESGLSVYLQGDPRGWPLLVSGETIQDHDTLRSGIVRVCPY